MYNSITASNMISNQISFGLAGASLTIDQRQLINDTLSEYDPNNLSEEDAISIVSAFSKAGIQPGRELAEAMEAAGFDARLVGEMAGLQGPPSGQGMDPQGHGNGFNFSEEILQELYSLLDQYYTEDASDAERSSLIATIQELFGVEENMFNITV